MQNNVKRERQREGEVETENEVKLEWVCEIVIIEGLYVVKIHYDYN